MSFSHVIWLLKSQTFGLYLGWLLVPFTIYLSSYKLFSTNTPTLRASQKLFSIVQWVSIVSYRTVSHGFTFLLLTDKHLRFLVTILRYV